MGEFEMNKEVNRKVVVIAEAGVNHNGDLEMAKKLVDAAVDSGADYVKFQTFKAENLVTKDAIKAEYQKKLTGDHEGQFEMLKRLELSEEGHLVLIKHCKTRGIPFISTPFDLPGVSFLQNLGVPLLKIPSGEITNAPLLLKVARTGKPLILSTGMSTLGEIESALSILAFGFINATDKPTTSELRAAFINERAQSLLKERVTVLHCVTEYPAPYEELNLRAMQTIQSAFGLSVGYSDHSVGIAIPIAAAALGASVIEKHFTLDKNLPGPDHSASLEPDELKQMITAIRQVESAMGNGVKVPRFSELKNIPIARKSIVSARAIKKGEVFSAENLTTKRPGLGLSPMGFWDLEGSVATQDYGSDELIR
jgi:N-acetylneuraminate synthase